MTPDPRHPELLTQADARQLLERAGQIDYESTSVEALRSAAIEAGISPAAFEAALAEMRSKAPAQPMTPRRLGTRRLLTGLATVAAMMLVVAMMLIPNTRRAVRTGATSSEVTVRCLPMETAANIARSTLGAQSRVTTAPGSRVLRFDGSPEDLNRLTSALASAEKEAPSCSNQPPGR
jgi:hypothetical protein